MADLNTDIRYIKGIGETRAKALHKLGIATLGDLLSYFPRRWEDRTLERPIRELPVGEYACVRAMLAGDPTASRIAGGRTLVKVRAVDSSGVLDVAFFNQEYRKTSLHKGETYIFYGKVEGDLLRRRMTNPLLEPEGRQLLTGRIMPIYPLTAGITQSRLAEAMRQGLDACRDLLPDALPDAVRQAHHLCYAGYAYENIHFPTSPEALDIARRRLVFEELFVLACGLRLVRARRETGHGPACDNVALTPFYDALPFALTNAQRRAVEQAVSDMTSGRPMNRLCQGDVGSGKTMVAAACVWFAAQSGWQSALMAPTEILARQHYENLSPLFARFGLHCALLTGSTRAKERREILAGLSDGSIDLCIGTHALLTEDVQYARLGLVITDEQHRFGVGQRAALAAKSGGDLHPHVLVMSATPIPRTLALMLYGDLDLSLLNELPPGRTPVETYLIHENKRPRLYNFVRKQVALGRQVYIVCPAVSQEDPDGLKAAEQYGHALQTEVFPDLRVGIVHGKQRPKEKQAVMAAFAAGDLDVLVSTTVIEVGVDVPNASLMVIENADRFGLSQLHQLRGRVGRGTHQSYCVLLSDNENPQTRQRLKTLAATTDGFALAEADLKQRGPGDFFGTRQTGLPQLRLATLEGDLTLLQEAQTAARQTIQTDPPLTHPDHQALRRRISALFQEKGEIFN